MHNGRAPAAKVFTRQLELCHVGMFPQDGVNRLTQLADAFAMNDAHPQDATRSALRQIIQHQLLHLTRLKRVQVQHAIDRQLDGLVVHDAIKPRMGTDEHGFFRNTGAWTALRYAALG